MYPDFSYFLNDLFGTPVDNAFSVIQTFGFMLTMAILVGGYFLYLEFKRYEKVGIFEGKIEQEVIGEGPRLWPIAYNLLIGFVIGFKLVFIISDFEAFRNDAAGVVLSAKGSLLGGIIGALIIGGWKWYELHKSKLALPRTIDKIVMPHERVPDITIIAAVSGIIGARLFSIFENMEDFLQDPIGQLLAGSGLTIYGGLILAFIVVFWYVKRHNMPPIHVMDAVAPSLILGYAIGRLGCHFSGDGDWGIVNHLPKPSWFILPDWAWAYDYPHNVINSMNYDPVAGRSFYGGEDIPDCGGIVSVGGGEPDHCTRLKDPVFPTPLYESVISFIIFIVLWVLRKRLKIAGMLFFIYLIFNGIERFLIESIRVNEHYKVLGMNWSLSQFIGMCLFLIGVAGVIYLLKRGKRIK